MLSKIKSFTTFNISQDLLKNLDSLEYQIPTDIQAQTLPLILNKKNLIAQSQTGSGKTLAFALGILERIDIKVFNTQALVIAPTRELVEQISSVIQQLGRNQPQLKVVKIYGGVNEYLQVRSLHVGAHIIVSTPGRLLRLLNKKKIDLESIKICVLDEADRMLDMGFEEEVQKILKYLRDNTQFLCFSATINDSIKDFFIRSNKIYEYIKIQNEDLPQRIAQYFIEPTDESKSQALLNFLKPFPCKSAIIFTNTKDQSRSIHDSLTKAEIPCALINGDLNQYEREVAFFKFSAKIVNILIATDIAARGLDIPELDFVINFDIAHDLESFTHRLGRTARAEQLGTVIHIINKKEHAKLDHYFQQAFKESTLQAYEEGIIETSLEMNNKKVLLEIKGGKKDKLRPTDIIGSILANKDLNPSQIGLISIKREYTFIAIDEDIASTASNFVSKNGVKGRRFKLRIFRGFNN